MKSKIAVIFTICATIYLISSYVFIHLKSRILKTCTISKTLSYNVSTIDVSWQLVEDQIKGVSIGGHFKPRHCISSHKVVIIIPYRDREKHLRILLKNLHQFLQKQYIEYRIFVAEMGKKFDFNKGFILNAAFNEARKFHGFDCFIFQDVDLVPDKLDNLYNCHGSPKHLSTAIDIRNYTLSYATSFGGVVAFSKEHYTKVNGFSNAYFGWGKEDDDLYWRVKRHNLTIARQPYDVGRYTKLRHPHSIISQINPELYKTKRRRYLTDGLNNLTYQIISLELRPLFTWLFVEFV